MKSRHASCLREPVNITTGMKKVKDLLRLLAFPVWKAPQVELLQHPDLWDYESHDIPQQKVALILVVA